jgi:hypothetical protein
MPVQLAKLQNEPQQRQGPLYKPTHANMGPQEKSATDMIKDKATNMAIEAGTEAAQEAGTEYIVDPLKTKAKEMWQGFTAPAPATAPASSFTSAALPAELTGPMMSGAETATADAILSSGMTGAEALAGAGSVAPAAAPVASAVAPTAAAGTGAMATMGAAIPYVGAALAADELLGLGLREKVLGFSEGGQVNPEYANMGKMIMSGGLGPLAMKKMKEEDMMGGGMMGLASLLSQGGPVSKVKYAQSGGPIDEKIEVSYRGPLANN